jgi:hypothetical protein
LLTPVSAGYRPRPECSNLVANASPEDATGRDPERPE